MSNQNQIQQVPPAPGIPQGATPVFKTVSFGGFHKQSVLSYIYEMGNAAQSTQDRLNAQIDELTASREQLSRSVEEMEQRLKANEGQVDSIRGELSAERSRTGELSAMIDRMNETIDRQKQLVAEKDEKLQKVVQINEELREENTQLQGKKQQFERSSIIAGELVVRARGEAMDIVEEANRQAQGVLDEAAKQLRDVHAQFATFKHEMEAVEQRIEAAVITMQRKFADIGEAIDHAEENISRSVTYRPREFTLVGDESADPVPPKAHVPLEKQARKPEDGGDDRSFFRGAAEI